MKDCTEAVEQEEAHHSARVIEEPSGPSSVGPMSEPDVRGVIRGCCSDPMETYLRLDGDRIEEATFATDSRASAVACGSMPTKISRGMSLEEVDKITPEDLVAAPDGLPEESVHCAELAVSTLQKAIFNWRAPDET